MQNQNLLHPKNFSDIANAMEALSTCVHILRTTDEIKVSERNKPALDKIWTAAGSISEMLITAVTSSPIQIMAPIAPIIKNEDSASEQTSQEESKPVKKPEESPATKEEEKQTETTKAPDKEEIKKESSESPAKEEEKTEESGKEEQKPEKPSEAPTTIIRQSTEALARNICLAKVAEVAIAKKITNINDLSPEDRVSLKTFIASTFPESSLKSNPNNKKIITKFITELLREHLANQKQQKSSALVSTTTSVPTNIVKDEKAGNALLEKIEEKTAQEKATVNQAKETKPEISNSEESKKVTVTSNRKEEITKREQSKVVDSSAIHWKTLSNTQDPKAIENAVVNLRKGLGKGEGLKPEIFQGKKDRIAESIRNILVSRMKKDAALVKVVDTFKKDRDNAISGLLIDSFKRAATELAVAQ